MILAIDVDYHGTCATVAGILFEDWQDSEAENVVTNVSEAKRSFAKISDEYALLRGGSQKPLYITSAGIEQALAMECVASMYGKHRNPYLLKKVDQVCRGIETA